MTQTTDTASKILPLNALCRSAHTFLLACTEEELAMLILARLKSALENHGASYFTVDCFVTTLHLLAGYGEDISRLSLLTKLEREGKIAIVPFSPADIYRIVDEPSPNPQTRS